MDPTSASSIPGGMSCKQEVGFAVVIEVSGPDLRPSETADLGYDHAPSLPVRISALNDQPLAVTSGCDLREAEIHKPPALAEVGIPKIAYVVQVLHRESGLSNSNSGAREQKSKQPEILCHALTLSKSTYQELSGCGRYYPASANAQVRDDTKVVCRALT